jgi:hypothetical protein
MRRAQDARDRGKRASNREKKVAQTTALTAQAEGLSPPVLRSADCCSETQVIYN